MLQEEGGSSENLGGLDDEEMGDREDDDAAEYDGETSTTKL